MSVKLAATPLPRSLGGVRVHIDGQAAPLFAARPTQVNLQAPYELEVGRVVDVLVESAGRYSSLQSAAVVASQPALFALPASIDGFGAGSTLVEWSDMQGADLRRVK